MSEPPSRNIALAERLNRALAAEERLNKALAVEDLHYQCAIIAHLIWRYLQADADEEGCHWLAAALRWSEAASINSEARSS